ncbi:MAG TPA: MliC family protein [Longimicrobium sp.]|nr:MliC family protein [Longimicrobium sp.]
MSSSKFLLLAALVFGLAGCFSDSRQNEVTFSCEGGATITAWFDDQAVRIRVSGDTARFRLPQVRSRLGDVYEGSGMRLTMHGEGARLERDGHTVYHRCSA